MRKGSKHKPETIQRIREGRLNHERILIEWLDRLTHHEFDTFVRCHIIPRIKRQ